MTDDSPDPARAGPEANAGLSAATRTIADLVRERDELRTENKRHRINADWAAKAITTLQRQVERLTRERDTAEAESAHLTEALSARGPYCAQHGEHQPCSQHKWVRESEHP